MNFQDETKKTSTDEKKEEPKKKSTKEPGSESMKNMSRVLTAQTKYIHFPDTCRYVPVKRVSDLGSQICLWVVLIILGV